MIVRKLTSDNRASTTVDFAFAVPVILAIMLGTIQMGQYLHASGAMRHALGEGVRLAKVDPDASTNRIEREIRDELVAIDKDNIVLLNVTRSTASNGAKIATAKIKYKLTPMIPLIPVPAITISEEKTVWLPV
ncbi:pilus assembly protein [Altererythrobacter arenosus]|uniref:Pilus assembly protein n=1 Tax=Altererythrobacter arenosus TaxID=3032592 RepID=A0ABY8FX64_9SPHN|nr:TadE family protein [Altererythrobacter sp. CAU 1644]WFL76609.1 pilus assembly protein [Altererythrobacter sp. CAU 1644]